jgi:methyl-accepting chemotaxis protein
MSDTAISVNEKKIPMPPKKTESRSSIRRKLLFFSIAFFLLILVVGTAAFLVGIRQVVRTADDAYLQNLVETERLKLVSSVNGEIALVMKMAGSPIIKRYFLNPTDPQLEQLAFAEIAGYRQAFQSNSDFWVNDIDKKFYSDDIYSYTVNPDDAADYWYKMTLYETEKYNFNINYNENLKKTMLWLNAPVFDTSTGTKKAIGMVGTGIDLTSFVDTIYSGLGDSDELYIFNNLDEITGARDASVLASKKKLADLFPETGKLISDAAKNLKDDSAYNFSIGNQEITIVSGDTLHVDSNHTVTFFSSANLAANMRSLVTPGVGKLFVLKGGNLVVNYTDATVCMTGKSVKVFEGTVEI